MRWLLEEIIKVANGIMILSIILFLIMMPGFAGLFLLWLIGEFQKMLMGG